MAYLSPKTLTCPECDFSGQVTWVIGVGPHTRGTKPSYKNIIDEGPFAKKDSVLVCPECNADIPTSKAENARKASTA